MEVFGLRLVFKFHSIVKGGCSVGSVRCSLQGASRYGIFYFKKMRVVEFLSP